MNYTKTSKIKSALSSNFLAVSFPVLILLTPFNLVVAISSQRHSTVASGADKADCWDCTVAGFDDIRGNSLVDLMESGYSIQQAAIFSKDQNNFTTPIELLDTTTSPHLNAIGVFRVIGNSEFPPHKNSAADSSELESFKPGRQEGVSSGVVFDSCLVITNHHAVNLKRKAGQLTNPQIVFSTGPTGNANRPFEFSSKGTVVAQGDLKYSNDGDFTNDWAIVKLNTPIYNSNNPSDPRLGWKMDLRFHSYGQPGGRIVSGASHYIPSKYFPAQTSAPPRFVPGQRNCKIRSKGTGVQQGMWKTDCPSLGGASGSPIWTASNEVIALSRGSLAKTETINSVDPQGTDSNIAIPISTMFTPAELQRIKDKYGCDNKTSL